MKLNQITKDIAGHIGFFYYEQSHNISQAYSAITHLGITQIHYSRWRKRITIHLFRPGLLIGKKGKNIDALTLYLSKELKSNIKIHIIENTLHCYLTSFSVLDDFKLTLD